MNYLLVIASIVLVQLCWGTYGPIIRNGTQGLGGNHLLAFIFVGIAYFVIAVLPSVAILWTSGEKGRWTSSGTLWSLVAGTVTAIGALGVILALGAGGSPIVVMPLIFGGAPVVNTFYTMYVGRTYRAANPIFFAGLILVVAGAVTVLLFNPAAPKHAPPAAETAQAEASETNEAEGEAAPPPPSDAAESTVRRAVHEVGNRTLVLAFVALTIVCWGIYGPVLHKGQVAMEGSRLRPFLCVGMAYFVIAVLAPLGIMLARGEAFVPTAGGATWSLLGGTTGALGSLGVILAFNFGGKPIYVMPLVFGGAPVINTLVSIVMAKNIGAISPLFYAGLIVVVAGAVTVLVFAPKSHGVKPAAAR